MLITVNGACQWKSDSTLSAELSVAINGGPEMNVNGDLLVD